MFDKFKLNFYANKIVGYAYTVSIDSIAGVNYTIYLVILDANSYKFIRLSKIIVFDNVETNKLLACFDKYNIKFITCWFDTFINNTENIVSEKSRGNVLKLVKSVPKERKIF